MSFTTPTFDLLFESLQYKEKRQSKIAKNYERAEKRLEALMAMPESDVRDERIQGILDTQVWRLQRAEELVDEIADIKDVLPQDEFSATPNFTRDEVTGEVTFLSFDVTIKDSPYDDTFTGGGNLVVGSRGRGRHPMGGGRSWNTTMGLTKETVADGITEHTVGSSFMAEQWEMGDTYTFSIWNEFPTKETRDTAEVVWKEVYNPETYFAEIV